VTFQAADWLWVECMAVLIIGNAGILESAEWGIQYGFSMYA
jgi:hypothetical protein